MLAPREKLVPVHLKGEILLSPQHSSLVPGARLHRSRQAFGISVSLWVEWFASQPEILLRIRPAFCKERISLIKQSWNKFFKTRRKHSLSANCILAWLQLLLSLFHPAESAVRACLSSKSHSQSLKKAWAVNAELEHLHYFPAPQARPKTGCRPGDDPILSDPFFLCRLFGCRHHTECYLQLIKSIFNQEKHYCHTTFRTVISWQPVFRNMNLSWANRARHSLVSPLVWPVMSSPSWAWIQRIMT